MDIALLLFSIILFCLGIFLIRLSIEILEKNFRTPKENTIRELSFAVLSILITAIGGTTFIYMTIACILS